MPTAVPKISYEGLEDGKLDPDPEMDDFYQWAGLGPGSKVLDMGCGWHGRNYKPLHEKGFKVYGLDIDMDALKGTKDELEKHGIPANLVRADIKNIPFRKGVFDAIYLNAITAKDTKDAWKDISWDSLKRGGKAYINLIVELFHLNPGMDCHDFRYEPEHARKWFELPDSEYRTEFLESNPHNKDGDYGRHLVTKFLTKIEKI